MNLYASRYHRNLIWKPPLHDSIFASAMSKFLSVKNESNKGIMVISGFLTPWENAAKEIVAEFQALEKRYSAIEVVLMNCYGGSVFEGIPAFNVIRNSKKEVTTRIEGCAASMGGILYLAGKKLEMTKYSRLMLHRASTIADGDADALRSAADLTESLEGDLVSMIASRMEKAPEEIKAKYFNGRDNWFTPEQAKENGLCDFIVDG